MEIFKLVGSIFVDTDKANESLKKTDEKANSVGSTLLSVAGSAGKFAVGLTTAAAGAVTGLVALAGETANTADVIDKASIRMGISAESYQELEHAASLCGVEMSVMEQAAKKLVDTDISFDEAMENIYALEDAEERVALAAELFGEKVAYNMTPMLQASGEEMDAMKQEAHDLGAVMSNDMVKDGAALNDTITKIKEGFGGMVNQIGGALMPVISKAGEYIISLMPTFNAIIDQIMPVLVEMMDALLPILMELIEELLPPILEIIKALLPVFTEICKIVIPLFVAVLKVVVDLLVKYVIPAISNFVKAVKNIISEIKPTIENIKNVFINAWNTISTKTSQVFNGIKKTISSVMQSMLTVVKSPINAIIKMFNQMIKAMNALSFDIPSWVPVLGGKKFGFNIKEIPLLEKGGVLEKGQTGFLEGTGAEAVVPLENNKAWISAVAKDMQSAGVGGLNEQMATAMLDTMDRILNRLEKMEFSAEIVADTDRMFKAFSRSSREAVLLGRA